MKESKFHRNHLGVGRLASALCESSAVRGPRSCLSEADEHEICRRTNEPNWSNTSPVLRLGMDMLTLSRPHGKTDQTWPNKRHLLLEHRATPGQLPHQPTATCSGGPGESCNGERGKSGQFRQQHQQQELHQYRLQIVEAIPCFTHGCTWRRPNCPAFGAYLLSNEQCRSAVLHKWWNERDNEARQSPHNLRKEYPLKLWDSDGFCSSLECAGSNSQW